MAANCFGQQALSLRRLRGSMLSVRQECSFPGEDSGCPV
jgi:hypothetical protein